MANIAKKVRDLRKKLGLRQDEFAKKVGADNQSTVSKWERGLQKPNAERMTKLAELAGETIGEWMGIRPAKRSEAPARSYRVVGDLCAGEWKEALEWEFDDQYDVSAPVAPGMPNLPLRGYVVRGPSMNRIYPDGALVFVAATISNGIKPKNGNRVVVSRRNKNGLYEATLKEFVVETDGSKWLYPRSYDPEHQAPIRYKSTDSEEVTITGVVVASFIMESLR